MATIKRSKSQIKRKRVRKSSGHMVTRVLRWLIAGVMIMIMACAAAVISGYFYLSGDLPKIGSLADYHPAIITTFYADDNRKIAEFFKERRIVIPLSDMPDVLKNAFIAAEDARFYKHQGVDIFSIIRAFFKNLEAGTIVQGGSTITQQVTKSFLLTPERSYLRKIKEAILAYRIDKAFSKDEVLFLYLNQIYLGHGAYGVEAAAENYFDKSAKELDLAEAAMLAGLPQAPSRYSPFRQPEKAKQRQIYVLNRMKDEGYITNVEATQAISKVMDIKPRRNWYIEEVPYYTEYVRQYVKEKYGEDALLRQGLQVHTAVNIEMQKMGREEILKGLRSLDKRIGFRGAIQQLAPEQIEPFIQDLAVAQEQTEPAEGVRLKGVVIAVDDKAKKAAIRTGIIKGNIPLAEMRWARKPDPEVASYETKLRKPSAALTVGDVVWVQLLQPVEKSDAWTMTLEQQPDSQAALLCIEAESGQVKAMVGGIDFRRSQFNRAVQSRRQPGSAFKPVIYAAALDKGYTPATVMFDSPIVYVDEERDVKWKPKNYGKTFHGATLLRKALAKSYNVVTVKILKDIGVDYAIDYARKLGIESNINRDLSIALGSSGLSLLEMVRAYSIFNNQGYLIPPVFVTRIVDRDGNILEENEPAREKAIEKNTAYIMTSLLESVVKQGTGHRVKALRRPVAGKTGTTNDLYDAWFVGYTPRYTTGVWVGFDNERSLGKGETGSRAASPIWLGFMQRILEDKPVRVFQVPEGVVFAKIDAETGLLPIAESKNMIFECFKEGTAPTEYTRPQGDVSEPEQFFKSGI